MNTSSVPFIVAWGFIFNILCLGLRKEDQVNYYGGSNGSFRWNIFWESQQQLTNLEN